MTDDLSLGGLLTALFLPWLCGTAWLYWLLGRSGRGNIFVVLGQGYFVGMFVTTLLIRLWNSCGLALDFWGIATTLAALGLVACLLCRLRPGAARLTHGIGAVAAVPRWQIVLVTVLLVLIAWRHLTMAQELLLRPLFAWDAWMNWVPKAIVWFHQGTLIDFISAEQWLQQPGAEGYTLGNRQATLYPIAVPLIQLWAMLGLGTWDNGAVYLPWILASVALGLALYGHLRLAGVPLLASVIASYFLLSLPYLNVHAVMAGYADIWLAAAFSLAVFSLYEWRTSRHPVYGALALLLALMCIQLKNPGLVLGLIVLACGVWGWFDAQPRVKMGLLFAAALAVVVASLIGISATVPYIGDIALQARAIIAGRLGEFDLEYHAVGIAFARTFFVQINWHLLWYLLPPLVLLGLYRNGVRRLPPAEWLAVIGALLFVLLVFVFTRHYEAAINFVTLNRALLYPVPAMVFCLCLGLFARQDKTG